MDKLFDRSAAGAARFEQPSSPPFLRHHVTRRSINPGPVSRASVFSGRRTIELFDAVLRRRLHFRAHWSADIVSDDGALGRTR